MLTGRTTAACSFDAVSWLRAGHNVTVVEADTTGVKEVIKALRRGEVRGSFPGSDFFQNGVPVTFFGRETTLPPGAIRVAQGHWLGGRPHVRLPQGWTAPHLRRRDLTVPRTRDLRADVRAGMATLTARLEEGIGASPQVGVLFQRAWPSATAAPLPDAPRSAEPDAAPVRPLRGATARGRARGAPPTGCVQRSVGASGGNLQFRRLATGSAPGMETMP